MKTLTAFVLAFILGAPAYAGLWETKCASCHNGAVAPSKKSLLEKYKTPRCLYVCRQESSMKLLKKEKGKKKEEGAESRPSKTF